MGANTKTCPHCRFEIPASAGYCGHCGRQVLSPVESLIALVGGLVLLWLLWPIATGVLRVVLGAH